MNRSSHRAGSLAAAAIVTLLTAHAAIAASTSPGVRAACPGVEAALAAALAPAWSRHQINSTVRVDMQLQGQRILEVSTPQGLMDYRAAVQRAVSRLNCNGGGDERRTISFDVRFTDEPDTPSHG